MRYSTGILLTLMVIVATWTGLFMSNPNLMSTDDEPESQVVVFDEIEEQETEEIYVETDDEMYSLDELEEEDIPDVPTNITLVEEDGSLLLDVNDGHGTLDYTNSSMTITTMHGDSVRIDVDENSVSYDHDTLDEHGVKRAQTGLCIAGLGGDDSVLNVEYEDEQATVDINIGGDDQIHNNIQDQYEECTGNEMSSIHE